MARIHPHAVAQRVRYPNGTSSTPFIVTMCKADMVRFAHRIINDQWPAWKGCLLPDGKVDTPKMEAKIAADDFDAGSARLACAHDGRFWSTIKQWSRSVHDYSVLGPDDPQRALTQAEVGLLFHRDDEFGWRALDALGVPVDSAVKALARTVLAWSEQIEEWS
jgi:hypothetical protein